MAGERTGFDVVIKVNTGTAGSPVWTAVASQRGATITPTADNVDVSSKESLNRIFEPGMRSWTISVEALFVGNVAAFNRLQTAFRSDDNDTRKLQIMKTVDGTNKEWIYAFLSSPPEDYPYDSEATLSLEFQATGGWTAV